MFVADSIALLLVKVCLATSLPDALKINVTLSGRFCAVLLLSFHTFLTVTDVFSSGTLNVFVTVLLS